MMNLFSLSGLQSRRADLRKYIYIFAALFFILIPKKSYSSVQASFSGDYEVRYLSLNNLNVLNPNIKDDVSYGDIRFRLKSEFAINENTKGVVALESGHTIFGIDSDNQTDENLPGEDNLNLKLKNAYIDVILPNRASNFIFGLQPVYIFDGFLANEDAFGITYKVEADRIIHINYVKISENKPDDEYANADNPQRTSSLLTIYYENEIFKVDTYSLLLGYYLDKEAIIDNVMFTRRKSTYFGLGYKWEKHGIDSALHILYGSGRKKYISNVTGELVSEKNEGFFVDLLSKKSYKDFDLSFELLLATGDDNKLDKKDREFISVDGLTNFYDRAYILTGYVTKDNADEKVDVFDTSLYTLTNIVFFRLGTEYRFSNDKRLELAAMYAMHDKKVTALSGKTATEMGSEFDATFSVDLYDTYYDTGEGLLLNFFAGYFIPSTVYELPDASDADDVYIFGTGLEYKF
jgi:hypothetical protein